MSNELWRVSAVELASGIRARDFSAREVIESVLARIAKHNPTLNAITLECADEARAAARQADEAVRRFELGPLHGVPVTIKENVDQRGKPTPNGVPAFANLIAPDDAPLVANLKRAGAIVVGRTNTPEFSMRATTDNPLLGEELFAAGAYLKVNHAHAASLQAQDVLRPAQAEVRLYDRDAALSSGPPYAAAIAARHRGCPRPRRGCVARQSGPTARTRPRGCQDALRGSHGRGAGGGPARSSHAREQLQGTGPPPTGRPRDPGYVQLSVLRGERRFCELRDDGANVDFANYATTGQDPIAAIRGLARWINYVHAKDVRKTAEGWQSTYLGNGTLPLKDIIGALDATGQRSPLCFEFAGEGDPEGGIRKSLEFLARLAA